MVCWMTVPFPSQTNEVYRFCFCKAHSRRCSSYLQPYDLSVRFLDSPIPPLFGIERKYGHENTFQDGEFEADLPTYTRHLDRRYKTGLHPILQFPFQPHHPQLLYNQLHLVYPNQIIQLSSCASPPVPSPCS